MPRRRPPFEQKAPQPAGYAPADDTDRESDAAAGKSAGMPRFLSPATQAAPLEPDVDDLLAGVADEDAEEDAGPQASDDEEAEPIGALTSDPLPDVSGIGIERALTAFSLTLRGRTHASFASSFRTRDVRTTPATGCDNCDDGECVSVSGTLESTFRVTTRVTLPSVSDFPDLIACQRQRVRDGINNVLAPHEQQHVAAFRTYNGTVQTPFSFTICRSEFNDRVRDLHNSIESARQSSAQAASDALDPFEFDVDLDCED